MVPSYYSSGERTDAPVVERVVRSSADAAAVYSAVLVLNSAAGLPSFS